MPLMPAWRARDFWGSVGRRTVDSRLLVSGLPVAKPLGRVRHDLFF
jgi:hypothetical protein